MTQHVSHRRSDEIHELRAEIERLRANEAAAIFSFRETNDIALEEIKRLTAALQLILDDTDDDWVKNACLRALEPKP